MSRSQISRVRSLLPSFTTMISKIGASFGMVRYASSTTARIFASSLNAGKMTDSDFMTARKFAGYQIEATAASEKNERVLLSLAHLLRNGFATWESISHNLTGSDLGRKIPFPGEPILWLNGRHSSAHSKRAMTATLIFPIK